MAIVNELALVVNTDRAKAVDKPRPRTFVLRLPPSKNRLYIQGRVKTHEYRAWQNEARQQIEIDKVRGLFGNSRRHKTIINRVAVHIEVAPHPRRDVQNVVDPICDLLQFAAVIENDRQIQTLHVDEVMRDPATIKVEVFPLHGAAA